MAERTVKVRLTATMDQYVSEMNKAANATREVGTQGAKLAQTQQAFDMVGRSALALGGLAAAGLGVAVAKFADFQEAMSYVAATGADAKASIEGLRDAALEAGATTVYSATEAANAIEELAKAGVSARDILGGGLDGALSLAAAGGLEVAKAAEIAATALNTFNLEGRDMEHVADLLAAGAGKAMGSVEDLGQALNQSALVADGVGLSIEETTAGLAAFASQGLLGSDAGTSFKTMLLQLTPTSEEAADLMRELGLSAYDQQGNFVGLATYAGKLESALGTMSAEQQTATLKTIFGNDAYRAASILLDEGAAGIQEWTKNVNDQGFAAEQAAEKLNNLKGDLEALTGAFDSAMISMGGSADGPLRAVVQGLTGLVDGFNGLPEGGKTAVFWIGAVGAAVALAGGSYLLAVPKIAAYNAALATMGPAAQRTGRMLSGVGKAAGFLATMGVAVSVLDKLATGADRAAPGLELITKTLSTTNLDGAFANASKGAGSFAKALELIEGSSFDSAMERIGETLGGAVGITGQVTEAREGFVALDGALAQLASGGQTGRAANLFKEIEERAKEQGISVEALKKLFPEYENALAGATSGNQVAAEAIEETAEKADLAAENLEAMRVALEDVGGKATDMAAAGDAASRAINALAQAALEEGATMFGSDDASISFRDSLREVEQAARDSAEAILDNGGSFEEARDEWGRGRQAIIDQAEAMGLSREEATYWADTTLGKAADVELGLRNYATTVEQLPDTQVLTILADTVQAYEAINGLIYDFQGREITLAIGAQGEQTYSRDGGRTKYVATGGPISGPGTGTSDSIPAMLSNGEHVWTAAEVRAAGGHGAIEDMRKWVLGSGGMTYRANGGGVGTSGGSGGSMSAPLIGELNVQALPGMDTQLLAREIFEQAAFAARGH